MKTTIKNSIMEFSGPFGESWTMLALQMTWPSSHTVMDAMQDKTDLLNLVSGLAELNINMNKNKIIKTNTKSKNVITVEINPLEETDCFA